MEPWSYLKLCSTTLLLLTWAAAVNSQKDPYVETPSGNIQGSWIDFKGRTVQQYLGIPYAKPPIGDLRFKKTQPVDPWNGTLEAVQWSPACIQHAGDNICPWDDIQSNKSEDCLYLNIWVPVLPSDDNRTGIPVMFWIHGGGYKAGSSRVPVYNGQALSAVGQIIVVTINYRLSFFGFFISNTEAAPGNAALYDMLEALKWVNKNIGAFGGDPNQVTIAGESAGSWSVGYFCVSPLTTGLFHRVIMESGSPAHLASDNNTANIIKSQKLAEALGCADDANSIYLNPESVVECMKKVDASEIINTQYSILSPPEQILFPNFGDEILPNNPRLEIISGNFHSVDVLIGNNLDEGTFLTTSRNPHVYGFYGEKTPPINRTVGEMTIRSNFSSLTPAIAEDVVRHYLGNVVDDDYSEVRQQISNAVGDFALLCPTVYFAEKYGEAGNDVRFYFFVRRPSTTPWAEWMGAVHFEEVQFVFGVPLQRPDDYTFEEVFLSKRVIRVWSNWVKKGITSKFKWPVYTRENSTYVIMDYKFSPRFGEGPHKDNCDFFRPVFGFI